jgi:hypothetical protein|tara:strand:+ start:1075 stop:1356 length:282 start_codon:yes stop_codon:yes gene_type:complete
MSLGLGTIFTGLSALLGDKRTGGGDSLRMTARKVSQAIDFSSLQRPMQDPKKPEEVKGYRAIPYEQLNKIWDDILRSAYTDASVKQDTTRLIK